MKRLLLLLAVLPLAACCVGNASGPDAGSTEDIELVGHIGGAANAVAARGDYVYASFGAELAILDVANPASPERVGYVVLQGVVEDVVMSGDYAYVLVGSPYDHVDVTGWLAVDISDPRAPLEVSEKAVPDHIVRREGNASRAVVGHYAYIANGSAGGLRVVDISDPAIPVEVGSYGAPGVAARAIADGGRVYVASHEGALWIVDVSDPARPSQAGLHPTPFAGPSHSLGLAVDEGHAYIAVGNNVRVIDVSNPAAPVEISTYTASVSAIHGMTVQGDHLYVVAEVAGPRCRPDGGFRVLDVSDPAKAREVGGFDVDFGALGNVVVEANYAYVAGWTGLLVVDVSDPTQPTAAGSHYTPGNAYSVAVTGDHAYVADGFFGLRMFDVSTPTAAVDEGNYGIATVTRDVAAGEGQIYVSNDLEGLWVLDVSDPAAPAKPRHFHVPGQPRIAVAGKWVYVLEPVGGLYLLRVP
jgi:hypothetical protein